MSNMGRDPFVKNDNSAIGLINLATGKKLHAKRYLGWELVVLHRPNSRVPWQVTASNDDMQVVATWGRTYEQAESLACDQVRAIKASLAELHYPQG